MFFKQLSHFKQVFSGVGQVVIIAHDSPLLEIVSSTIFNFFKKLYSFPNIKVSPMINVWFSLGSPTPGWEILGDFR